MMLVMSLSLFLGYFPFVTGVILRTDRPQQVDLDRDSDDGDDDDDQDKRVEAVVHPDGLVSRVMSPSILKESTVSKAVGDAALSSPPSGKVSPPSGKVPLVDGMCPDDGVWTKTPPNKVIYNILLRQRRHCSLTGWDAPRACETCGPPDVPEVPENETSKPVDPMDAKGVPLSWDFVKPGGEGVATSTGWCFFDLTPDKCLNNSNPGESEPSPPRDIKPDGTTSNPDHDCAKKHFLDDKNKYAACRCWDGKHIAQCDLGPGRHEIDCYKLCQYCPQTEGYDYTKPGVTVIIAENAVQRSCDSNGLWGKEECFDAGNGVECKIRDGKKTSSSNAWRIVGWVVLGLSIVLGLTAIVWFRFIKKKKSPVAPGASESTHPSAVPVTSEEPSIEE